MCSFRLVVPLCFKLYKNITMKAWMEKEGPSTSHNRPVWIEAVTKGLGQLESMPRGRADSEMTHGGRLLYPTPGYGVTSISKG